MDSSSTKGVVAIATLIFGAAAGEYAAIVFCALAGSLWALQRVKTDTRVDGALMILRLVLTAVVLTAPALWWLEANYHWPAGRMLPPVAFAIGAFGDRWPELIEKVRERLLGLRARKDE